MISNEMNGTLFIVATPIGNLGDITLRALETLKSVNIIAAEDTRHTIKLLNHYDIKTKLISHHIFNEEESTNGILLLLEKGMNVALVSDAGMPCISDPGYILVKRARQNGFNITCMPGASAATSAVALSGLDAGRFRFEGFLPKNNAKRIKLLEDISKDGCAVIIYEAPHRLIKTINELADIFIERNFAIVNDISKIHEKVITYNTDEIKEEIKSWKLKGEFVIVIEKGEKTADVSWEELSITEHVEKIISEDGLSKMEAIKKTAKQRGIKKGDVYNETFEI